MLHQQESAVLLPFGCCSGLAGILWGAHQRRSHVAEDADAVLKDGVTARSDI